MVKVFNRALCKIMLFRFGEIVLTDLILLRLSSAREVEAESFLFLLSQWHMEVEQLSSEILSTSMTGNVGLLLFLPSADDVKQRLFQTDFTRRGCILELSTRSFLKAVCKL